MSPSVAVVPAKAPSKPEPELERPLHCAILLDDRTLGDETFRLVRLQGQEGVSDPFEFDLELHESTDFGPPARFAVDELIGRPATIGIALPGKGADPKLFEDALKTDTAEAFQAAYGDDLVVYNGIVAAASLDVRGVHHVTLKPSLWRLALTNRYTIHRSRTVLEAIAGTLGEHRVEYSMKGLESSLADSRRQDWLQAGETDYDFVRRLMAKAHVYYYHVHCGRHHQLRFANNVSYPKAWPVKTADKPPREIHRVLCYDFKDAEPVGLQQDDVVHQFAYKRSLVSSGVRSVFANQGAAWHQDPIAGFSAFTAPAERAPTPLPFNLYKVYQYGVSTPEVEDYTAQTERTLGSSGVQLSGSTSCARFRVAHTFKMDGTGHAEIDGRTFVLTQVQHEATLDGTYRNQFQATDAGGLVVPFSVQETQQGNVLARVVPAPAGQATPSGSKPDTWKWYRKENFGYAQLPLQDRLADPQEFQATGVYVEFATEAGRIDRRAVWVKLAPHLTGVPEIGTMVLVSRANDESELPEIQSVQANGSFTVTPGKWTANTHVGSSYSTSYGDSKSLRYGETSKAGAAGTLDVDAASMLVEAKHRTGKFREATYSQGGAYSYSASEQGRDGLLSDSISYGSTHGSHYAAETKSFSDIGAVTSTSIAGTTDSTSTVNGTSTSTSTCNGAVTSTNTYNAAVTSTTSHTGAVSSTTTHNGDVTSTLTHETGDTTSTSTYKHKVTSTATHDGAVGSTTTYNDTVGSTTTHGKKVTSTTTVNADSENTSTVTGTATNTSTHNVVHNSTTVNLQDSITKIGAQASLSLVGASADLTVSGATAHVSRTGLSTQVSVTDIVASLDILGTGLKYGNQAALLQAEALGPKCEMLSSLLLVL